MLAHESYGRGPAVVFIHCFPLDRSVWTGQLHAVGAAGCRAVMVDLPGFGGSPVLASAPSLEAYAHALLSTLDELAVDRAIFVGLSLGGYVALALAAVAPERVAGLVLADTRAAADEPATRTGRIVNLALVRDHGVGALFEKMLPGLVTARCPAPVKERMRAVAAAQSREGVTFALLAMRDRPDRTALLPAVTAPTLVLVGEHDLISTPDEMRRMALAIPGARFEQVLGAGHVSNLEQPERFNAALQRFLSAFSAS